MDCQRKEKKNFLVGSEFVASRAEEKRLVGGAYARRILFPLPVPPLDTFILLPSFLPACPSPNKGMVK